MGGRSDHELVGMESCGKTMMCTLSMIEFQKKHPDKLVAIIDVENAFDIEYAKKMGLDVNRLYFPAKLRGIGY